MTFGEYIRQRRLELELTQQDLAGKLQMDTPMYSRIERDLRPLRRALIPHLAQHLNLDAERLETRWLAQKVYMLLCEEPGAGEALHLAESQLQYQIEASPTKPSSASS